MPLQCYAKNKIKIWCECLVREHYLWAACFQGVYISPLGTFLRGVCDSRLVSGAKFHLNSIPTSSPSPGGFPEWLNIIVAMVTDLAWACPWPLITRWWVTSVGIPLRSVKDKNQLKNSPESYMHPWSRPETRGSFPERKTEIMPFESPSQSPGSCSSLCFLPIS